jgi:CubicO group peptidase (beta-lactamase class C family)
MRRVFALIVSLFALTQASAQSFPETNWERADTAKLGWSMEMLAEAERYAAELKPTAVMVVQHGKVIAAWGNVAERVNTASVRKSLLSALYGIAVGEGRIDLKRTLNELGIDDREPALTAAEKRATIRDLLMARSGIFHAAAYESPEMAAKRPARGSHPPGAFWYYNNWDFNALGTIYERLTGERIFESFEQRIARPIGMEDFSAKDSRYVREESSDHPAYVFWLTARDFARVGLLFLRGGAWKDKQIIPAAWVKESTAALTAPADFGMDYGYMWWRASDRVEVGRLMGTDTYYALGYGGQALAVVPSRDLVLMQLAHLGLGGGVRHADREVLFGKIVAAAPVIRP